MPSPRPEPTALKVLKGNPGKRPLPAHEPELARPTPEEVACPAELAGDARAEWERLAGPLAAAGILTAADLGTFRRYCVTHARVLDLERKVLAVDSGDAIKLGYVNALDKLEKQLRAWAIELGLTPSARSKVRAAPPAAGSKLEDFLFGDKRRSG